MSSTSIGSAAWLRQERSSISRLYGQDVEDFTFSARQEMDWLNEHMEGVFAASMGGVDISELLKTPSRSTKKAVLGGSVRKLGSARKRMGGALKGKVTTNVEDVFNSMLPPPLPARVSPPLITQLAADEEEAPVQNQATVQPAAEPVDIENQATQEDSQMSLSVSALQRTHAHPSRRVSKVDTFRDSGNWSQSSGVPSQQHQRIMARPRSPQKAGDCEPAVAEGEDEADVSVDMGRKSIASATYHTANEGEEEEREIVMEADAHQDRDEPEQDEPKQEQEISIVSFGQSSPFQEHVDGVQQGRNSKGRSSAHSANVASSPLRVLPVIEKRRSGRGASDATVKNIEETELQAQQEEVEELQTQKNEMEVEGMDAHPPSSPPTPIKPIKVTKEPKQTPSPVKEVGQLPPSPVPAEPEYQDEEHTISTSSGSPVPIDETSPVPTFLRKSSLSFASLPPRGRVSTATTETVKLGGAGSSSWLHGRRTLGKSLGGRLPMPGETLVIEDSEENAPATEKPRERKRSRGGEERDAPVEAEKAQEPVASKGSRRSSRKKSRSASYKGSDEELAVLPTQKEEKTTQGDEMNTEDDVENKVAEHNKSASQRLQERIQQLGKLNSSARTTTSLCSTQETQSHPVEAAEPMYPDLPEAKGGSKSRTSVPQEQLQSQNTREPSVEEDDWIPPVRSASVRTAVTANKSSTNLGRSKTVPAQNTPGTKSQALHDGLTKKHSEQSFEDALQKKSSRGELTPFGRPNLPQALAFNAINSPNNIVSPARTAGTRFEDKVSIPLSPKPANKKSFVATSSSLQKSTTTEDSPVTTAKSQATDAFKRAKEMFKTNVLGSPASAESLKSDQLGHKPSFGSIGRSSSPRTPQGQISKQGTPNREMYPDLGNNMEEGVGMGVKSKRQTRGSKNKDMLQKQQGEEERLARETQEAQRLKEEEQAQKAAAEEKARQEEKARLEEKRRLAEQRRKEKELQRQLAAQKKAEEAMIQREKEKREEEMKRNREELQKKEEELKRLMEEQRLLIQKREEEARLRQEQEEEMRRQVERHKREEEEVYARKEVEVAETRRIAEQEAEEEEARKHAELEQLRRKQDEDLRRKQDAEERRKRETTPTQLESDEEVEVPAVPVGNASASRIARPKSVMGGRPPSRLQPPSGGKRPLRPQPPQKAERGKPTPVSIQVGTASQRAAMDRQKPVAPPPAALLSAMKDTFAPKERPATAEPTLAQSNSAPNLKKSTSTQSITASASTSNLKKSTMDEKKREENRRLIEARREEIRRKEAAAVAAEEEKRKAGVQQGRRAVERDVEPPKKAIPKSMGAKGPATKITRVPANANLRKLAAASVEDVTITPQQEREPPDTEPSTKKGPKRAFNTEDELLQTTTAAPTATGSTYGNRLAPPKMPDAKKRKTEEWELDNLPPPPTVPAKAPVRPSVAGGKRDWPAKSTYVQGYTGTATAASVGVPSAGGSVGSSGSGGGSGASTIKVATKAAASSSTITTTVPTAAPHVEGVKFSNEKIRFAADSTTTTPGPSHGPSKTPKEKPILKKSAFKTPNDSQKRVFSPMKGDGIELPEIPTDSEDDYSTSPSDSDSDSFEGPSKSSRFPVPHWAASPELKQALVAQQTMDPEEVFGPIGPLQMEEIFRGSGAQGKARFRNRSSSANWSTGDKLTREEIERDREARVRMIQRGGWDMGVMPEGDEGGSSRK